MWTRVLRSASILLITPWVAFAGGSLNEQCDVRAIHVEFEGPPGSANSEMAALIEAAFADRGFRKTENRDEADAFLTATVRITNKMHDGITTTSASLDAALADKAGSVLWQKKLEPNLKFNPRGTNRTEALEERAGELAKKLAKSCNKGWKK